MIRTIRDKRVHQIIGGVLPRRFPPGLLRATQRRLLAISVAERIEDLRIPPSMRLERLRGDRDGMWSVRINMQWRLCFYWVDGAAEDVEIVDYH